MTGKNVCASAVLAIVLTALSAMGQTGGQASQRPGCLPGQTCRAKNFAATNFVCLDSSNARWQWTTGVSSSAYGWIDKTSQCGVTTNTTNLLTFSINEQLVRMNASGGMVAGTGGFQAQAGTAAAPAFTFAPDPDTGFYNAGANQLGVAVAGARAFLFAGTGLEGASANSRLTLDDGTGSQLAYSTNFLRVTSGGVSVSASVVDLTAAAAVLRLQGVTALSSVVPAISAGFGTAPSIAGKAYAFQVTVGTGGTATDGTVNLGVAPTTSWNCTCTNMSAAGGAGAGDRKCIQASWGAAATVVFNSRSSAGAVAFAAGDVLAFQCLAY